MQAMEALMGLEPTAGGDTASDAPQAPDADRAHGPHDGHGADLDEARLIRATKAGDEEAFAVLVRRHQGRVFRLAGRFFRQRQDVEEVAQETFLRAWLKLGTYSARAPFEHWLTRLCLRCAYDRLRRREPRQHVLATAPNGALAPDDVAAPAGDPDARLEVERLLERLSRADRFLLVLLE